MKCVLGVCDASCAVGMPTRHVVVPQTIHTPQKYIVASGSRRRGGWVEAMQLTRANMMVMSHVCQWHTV